jgi:hypothetical protein
MKTFAWTLALVGALLVLPGPAAAQCTTIDSGQLLYQPGHYLAGQPISTGVNPFGYNYQAHAFSGSYFNAYAGRDGLPPWDGDDAAYVAANPGAESHWAWGYRFIDAAMKWNDAWLSNKDCNGDGLLDRPDDFGGTYVGSGAWLTNHNSWTVTRANGKQVHAGEFIKIVALPEAAVVADPVDPIFGEQTAYLNGRKMGAQIWGDFAVIQYVASDKSLGYRGLVLKSDLAAGFGFYR